MRTAAVLVLSSTLAGALAGCGAGSAGSGGATAVVDTVAGVERLRYPGAGGPELGWSADTIAVLGGADVDADAYQFDQVAREGLAADADGRLYVLDRAGRRILVYDADGRHLATFGRSGGGPGELASPVALALGPGDSIWVTDIGNQRYTVFPIDGGEARSVPFPEEAGFAIGDLAIRGGGPIQTFRAVRLRGPDERRPAEPPPEPPRTILRLGPDGDILDTLWTTPPPRVDEVQSGNRAADQVIVVRMSRAFEAQQHWQAFPDGGLAVADSTEYIVRIVAPDGTLSRLIERDLPARATTEADKELARQRLRERLTRGGGIRISIGGRGGVAGPPPEQLLEAQLASMTFAPVIPRITGIRIDPLGRIWVGISLDEPGTTARVDVYDRDGRLLGELPGWELPDVFLGPSRAARIVRDELDVQQIVVYELDAGDTRTRSRNPES
ncbi:MAG TPA: 6-bladed beta-propeller [Longimicrobiales bacterium]